MKKRFFAMLLCVILCMECLPGCSANHGGVQGETKRDDRVISIYLWDISLCARLPKLLREAFPELEFDFVVGHNNIDFYSYLDERGVLPDIITCRRFSLNDAAAINDRLLDLSETDLAGSFYSVYLENNRFTDGSVRWLPLCGEMDGIIANTAIFEACGLDLPTDYAEFVHCCDVLEANGYRCFVTDYDYDYTNLEVMQGCAIPALMRLEGTLWRRQYESAGVDETILLDDEVWPEVFARFERFLEDTHARPEDAHTSFSQAMGMFREGKAAMFRGTGGDLIFGSENLGMELAFLPYFGDTEADNWILTYPHFQVAVNGQVAENEEKYRNVMAVLDRIFSQEGQSAVSGSGVVVSYRKGVDFVLPEPFDNIRPCIQRNHLYQRLASNAFFSISQAVGQRMVAGEYDAQAAYAAFNALLSAPADEVNTGVVASIDTAYAYRFDAQWGGSRAVSAVANTLCREAQADALIGFGLLLSSDVFAGEYTWQQLCWLISGKGVAAYEVDATGAEIREILKWALEPAEDGFNPISDLSLVPVMSRMAYTMKDNGDGALSLGTVTVDGQPLEDDAVYHLLLWGSLGFQTHRSFPELPGDRMVPLEKPVPELLQEALSHGGIAEPTPYTVLE